MRYFEVHESAAAVSIKTADKAAIWSPFSWSCIWQVLHFQSPPSTIGQV